MLTAEQREKKRAASRAWSAAHPDSNRASVARYRDAHRDEINARQRAAYHVRKAAGTLPPSYRARKCMPITGTFCVGEMPDTINASGSGDLRSAYLLALMTRDAKIWRERQGHTEQLGSDGSHASLTPQKHVPQTEDQKAKRRAAWTPEKRAEQKRRTGTPLTLDAAREAGDKNYFRPTPCKCCGGHIYLVRNMACVECNRVSNNKSKRGARARAKTNSLKRNPAVALQMN